MIKKGTPCYIVRIPDHCARELNGHVVTTTGQTGYAFDSFTVHLVDPIHFCHCGRPWDWVAESNLEPIVGEVEELLEEIHEKTEN